MGLLSLLWCLLLYPAPAVSKQGARNLLNHSNQRFRLNPALQDLVYLIQNSLTHILEALGLT